MNGLLADHRHRILITSKILLYLAFSGALAGACYFRPILDDFDRYMYEALVRERSQPIEQVYQIIKHGNPRMEASSVLDGPVHLGQFAPLFAIRPLYVQLIGVISSAGVPIERSITLVSAISLFLISCGLAWGTKSYFYPALVMATPGVVVIGRMGGPDALSSLVVAAGCLSILREKLLTGILLLSVSVWVRTDNVLVVAAVIAWLAWERKLRIRHAIALTSLAAASVEWINSVAGNYGWKALFYCSFIGGKSGAEVTPHITVLDYARVFVQNAQAIAPQLAPWLLLGVVAWSVKSPPRKFLVPLSIACATHYLLFPSPEARYFVWAYLMTGACFILAVTGSEAQSQFARAEVAILPISGTVIPENDEPLTFVRSRGV